MTPAEILQRTQDRRDKKKINVPEGKRYKGRTPKPKTETIKCGPKPTAKNRIPRDILEFKAEINRITRELDFAVQMFTIELKEQLFTEEEIKQEVRKVLSAAVIAAIEQEYIIEEAGETDGTTTSQVQMENNAAVG